MLCKLSNLSSNLALTLSYLNPALKNSALVIILSVLTTFSIDYVLTLLREN